MKQHQARIEAAFDDRALLGSDETQASVLWALEALDQGKLRVAQRGGEAGEWQVNSWLKKAILLYFSIAKMTRFELGPFEYYDKIPLKRGLEAAGVRLVPPGAIRYGAFCERGVVVMPGYVNIGAYVAAGSMVDTWATVGSCAQIGEGVHLSGGVGIGGVLEPAGARPVIIEEGCFIGSRSIVVEGVVVEAGAVLGAGCVLTASTPIIDVRGEEEKILKGRVPARAVVVPGSRPKTFPAGTYMMPCALIIGERSESTDRKTSLNAVLREFAIEA